MDERLPRKLAAILYADVAGYSQLTGEDEDATHRKLSESLDNVTQIVESNGGRVMHFAGDAVLAMFQAVGDACYGAVAIQDRLLALNAELPERRKLRFRIGVNLGDVIEDRGDIYGDGVNVAARLESIAEPGGICISASVYEQVKGKFDLVFEDLGERSLKNIAGKTRVYRVVRESGDTSAMDTSAAEPFDMPDKPAIAVLPFQNMSDDHRQEYFADGIAEDIITVLSRIPDLVVIARNSSFIYKGQAVDVREVGRNLGVGYVLEGSVRKAEDRIRITAQLIDARTGDHIWADRFDRNDEDSFLIQDEITREVVVALSVKLTYGEEFRVWSQYASNYATWELFQRGMAEQLKFTMEGHAQALRIARQLCEQEPELVYSRIFLGWVLQSGARYGFVANASGASLEAERLVREVLAEDGDNADAHSLLGYVLANQGRLEDAVSHGERSTALAPGVATNHATLAISLFYQGDHTACLSRMKHAIRLTHYAPDWFLAVLGDAYRCSGEPENARVVFEHLAARMPGSMMPLVRLAAVYGDLGESGRARQAVEEMLTINPHFSVRAYTQALPLKLEADRQNLTRALLKAGLPE